MMTFNFDRRVDEIADLIAERALEKINERLVVLAVGALRQHRARIGRDHGSVGRDVVAITACDEHDHARQEGQATSLQHHRARLCRPCRRLAIGGPGGLRLPATPSTPVCATSTYSSSSINDAAGIAISCHGLEPFASGIR